MDIRNIADKGNVDRANDRPERSKTVVLHPQPPVVKDQDHATISSGGRDTLAAVEGLAERARKQGGERHEIVEAARAKLESGALGSPDILNRTAQRILDSGFLAG